MTLKLHNTMSGRAEYFKPIVPEKVGLYVCGPTVYDNAHVGHARAAVAFDVLVRHLARSGFAVDYVRNFTDVDDKIINRANERGQDWKALAETYIESFREDMGALNCLEPTHAPRATEYIGAMIDDIKAIVDRGLAYVVEGDVYFDVSAYHKYGLLSKREQEDMEAGARVSVDERKKHPSDFALWKAAKPGEPSWPSPWGEGRPGWHIECSAMSFRLLGAEFDIHGGGQDLIFPHHENELAQSGALDRPMAHYWLHNGFVRVNSEKMSKSLGNFFTVKDVLKSFSPEVLRFFLVSKHYRGPVDFSDEALREAEKALERIYRAFLAAEELMGDNEAIAFDMGVVKKYQGPFIEALDDDLNTAKALGLAFDAVRDLNRAVDNKDLHETCALYAALKMMGDHLGLWPGDPQEYFESLKNKAFLSPEEIEKMIGVRAAARAEKNWAEADRIRDELLGKGIVLEDKAGVTTWKLA